MVVIIIDTTIDMIVVIMLAIHNVINIVHNAVIMFEMFIVVMVVVIIATMLVIKIAIPIVTIHTHSNNTRYETSNTM